MTHMHAHSHTAVSPQQLFNCQSANDCTDESIVTLQCITASLVPNYIHVHVRIRTLKFAEFYAYVFSPIISFDLFINCFNSSSFYHPSFFNESLQPQVVVLILLRYTTNLQFFPALLPSITPALSPSLSLFPPHGVSHLLNEESTRVRLNFWTLFVKILTGSLLAATACTHAHDNAACQFEYFSLF